MANIPKKGLQKSARRKYTVKERETEIQTCKVITREQTAVEALHLVPSGASTNPQASFAIEVDPLYKPSR